MVIGVVIGLNEARAVLYIGLLVLQLFLMPAGYLLRILVANRHEESLKKATILPYMALLASSPRCDKLKSLLIIPQLFKAGVKLKQGQRSPADLFYCFIALLWLLPALRWNILVFCTSKGVLKTLRRFSKLAFAFSWSIATLVSLCLLFRTLQYYETCSGEAGACSHISVSRTSRR